MSTQPPRGIDRATAEQLLARRPIGGQAHLDDIAVLLSAAAGPAGPGELDGEAAALAAFRAARLSPVPEQRRRSMISNMLAKVFTVKISAIALAATAAGGVALASSTQEPAARPTPSVSVQPVQPAPSPSAGGRGKGESDAEHGRVERAGGEQGREEQGREERGRGDKGGANPSPSLVGLCRAYQAGVAESKGKALENPAFSALIKAAGGKDRVAAFCVKTAAKPGPAPSASREPANADPNGKAHGRSQEHKPAVAASHAPR